MTVRQIDIAEKCGISRIAVSKALHDHPDISLEMKAKVRKVAEELGYVPNFTARNLQAKKTFTIGVVIPDISNSFFSYAIHGIMDTARALNYHIVLTASRESAELEKENIMTLLSMRVDGLLVAISKETQDTSIFETVKRNETALVFFDRVIEDLGFSTIGIDDYRAASKLLNYMLDTGYQKIATLTGSSIIQIGRERHKAYVDVLTAHGIPVRQDWVIECGFSRRSGYIGCQQLLQSKNLPEAIYVANDRVAQGAYAALKEAGLHIPNDIGIAGFGHSEFAELLTPALSIINVAPDKLGSEAMQLLVEEINNPQQKHGKKIKIPADLQIKESLLFKSR